MDFESVFPKEQILKGEPLEKHTTFRVGGNAETFLEVKTKKELSVALQILSHGDRPYFILGNGSNLLVSDKGYDGVILHIGTSYGDIRVEGNRIIAQAGAMLSKVAYMAMEQGLEGLEFASGIPGSVGGGVIMNAGAYGGEMSQVVTNIWGFDKEGNAITVSGKEADFSYRNSIFKKQGLVVSEVEFTLKQGDKEQIQKVIQELSEKRREKQPLEYPSAGSTFKRPEGYFAGKLIMDAGLRGYRVGDAQISEKHCGFVVNRGKATATQINALMKDVQEKVLQDSGVMLEPEVIRLGEF